MANTSKILLAHEWLERTGGSENTFAEMIQAVPSARVTCLWNNAPERFPGAEESFLATTRIRDRKALSLLFMRKAWKSVDLTGVDTVVASSHAMSHHLAGRAAAEGIAAHAYVYSPPRYVWAADLDVRGKTALGRIGRPVLKRIDLRGVHDDVHYVGISDYVAARMRQSWGVDADVVYPPVDTERITAISDWSQELSPAEAELLASLPDEFVLGASRLIEYKRLDVPMQVGEALGMPVVIAGNGPFESELRALATQTRTPVHFVGRVSDEMLYALYQRAQLFVFMPIEDFGIMPVEAMALGTTALVRDIGGTREVAERLGGGVPVNPDDVGALASAARAAIDARPPSPESITGTFSHTKFRADFLDMIRT